jgi:hypothetical protein
MDAVPPNSQRHLPIIKKIALNRISPVANADFGVVKCRINTTSIYENRRNRGVLEIKFLDRRILLIQVIDFARRLL